MEVEVVEENHPQQGKCLLCLLHYENKQRRERDYFKLNEESANVIELQTKTDVRHQRYTMKTNPTAFRTNWGEIKQNGSSIWSRLNSASDHETGVRMARELYPRDYIFRRPQIESHLSRILHERRKTPREPKPRSSFIESDVMRLWFEKNIATSGGQKKSLILWGRSRTGKTEWARCLGKHWYMNHMWDKKVFDCNVQYGVLDNMTFRKFPHFKELMGGQICFDSSVTRLLWGKPCIWLCNEDPSTWKASKDMIEWMFENCEIEEVDNNLYEAGSV